MLPTATDITRLQDLSADFVAGKIDRDQGRNIFCDLVLERLRCSRVSLWRFEETASELSLLCFAFKTSGGTLVTRQSRLMESEYQDYFDHLVGTGMYQSNDALADPVLAPMRENYLLRDGVRAMLDAAFLVNGRAYGMVCCEQTDGVRRWRASEATLLRGLVSKLALLMAGAGDPDLWASRSLPMQARAAQT